MQQLLPVQDWHGPLHVACAWLARIGAAQPRKLPELTHGVLHAAHAQCAFAVKLLVEGTRWWWGSLGAWQGWQGRRLQEQRHLALRL